MAAPRKPGRAESHRAKDVERRFALAVEAWDSSQGRRKTNQSGFAVAPILYLLMMAGVAAGVLFSGYSQILRANLNVTNATAAKGDLSGARTTLSATGVFSADQSIFCPPRGPNPGAACVGAPQKMIAFGGADSGKLPNDREVASNSSTATEVGVFAAGAGVKQLDPWGRYYIYCRWENARSLPDHPAIAVISAGTNGRIETNCDAATPSGDDQIIRATVGEAINRASVWQQAEGSNEASFGTDGVRVTASGIVEAKGLILSGTATLAGLSLTSPLPITSGGTGADTAGAARANLGAGTIGDSLFVATTASGGRAILGATAMGHYLFSSSALVEETASAVRATLLGAGDVGSDVFLSETTTGARAVLGATTMGDYLFSSATFNSVIGAQARTTLLGASSIGDAVFTASTYDIALTGLGGTTVGKSLFQIESAPAGRIALGAGIEGSLLFTATSQLHAWEILGLTGTLNPVLDVNISGQASSVDASGITGGAVPIVHGGTGATTASGALDNLFTGDVTPAVTLSTSRIAANSISSSKLTNVVAAGTYNLVEVDTAGRVVSGSYQNYTSGGVDDGNGNSIVATATGGGYLYFSTASVIRMTLSPLGYLGLGITTPEERLHVYDGNIRISDEAGQSRELQFTTGASAKRWIVAANSAAESGASAGSNFVINRVTDGGAEINAMTIDRATGNTAFSGQVTASGGFLGVFTGTFNGEFAGGTTLGSSAAHTNPHRGDDESTGLFSGAAATVSIATSGIERLRVTSSGSVGIGTADPAYHLDVSGGTSTQLVHFTGTTTGAGGIAGTATGVAGSIQYNDGHNALAGDAGFVWNAGNLYLGIGTAVPRASIDAGYTSGAMIMPSGNTGQRPLSPVPGMIRYNSQTGAFEGYQGTTPAWGSLGSGGGGSGYLGSSAAATAPSRFDDLTTGLFSATSSSVSVATGGIERLRVTGTGSVGIGTADPKVSLDLGILVDALRLPMGSTDQRPSNSGIGMIRYNTTLGAFEGYTGVGWGSLGASSGTSGSTMVENWPDVILCSDGTGYWPLFLGSANYSGQYTYRNVNDTIYIIYTPAGAYSTQNGLAGIDCVTNTWSIAQLYEHNRAFNIVGGASGGSATLGASATAATPYRSGETTTGLFSPASGSVAITSLGTEVLRTTGSGFIGIGTIAPTVSLDVSKTDAIRVPFGTTGERPASGGVGMIRYNTTLGAFEGYTGAGWGTFSGGGGSATLGLSTAAANPYRNGEANTGLVSLASGSVGIVSLGTEIMRVTGTGYVGIGTTTPTSKLDVSGNINATGSLGLGEAGINANRMVNIAQAGADASKVGIYNAQTVSGALSANRTNYGFYNSITNAADGGVYTNTLTGQYNQITNAEGGGYGDAYGSYNYVLNNDSSKTNTRTTGTIGYVDNASGGTLATAEGARGYVLNSGAGSLTNSYALYGLTQNAGAGTISDSRGLWSYTRNTGAGSYTNAYGVAASINQIGAGGSIGTAYAFWAGITESGGSIGTAYLYRGGYTGGNVGTKWGLYLTGETNNYLSGTLGIKTASVTAGAALDLSGATGTAFSSLIVPADTSANRPTTGVAGMIRYNTTLGSFEGYTASGWGALGSTATAGSSLYLGASTAATNPSRESEPSTGLFTPASGSIGLVSLGTEVLRTTASGYVGIGNTTPAVKLDVAGDMNATGNLGLGGAGVVASRGINLAQTSVDAGKVGLYSTQAVSGTLSGNRTNYSSYNVMTNTADKAAYSSTLTGQYNQITNAEGGSYSTAYGSYSYVVNNDSSKTNDLTYATIGKIQNVSTGTLANAYGALGHVVNTGEGTVTDSFGVYGQTVNNSSGIITTAAGAYGKVANASSGSMDVARGSFGSVENTGNGTINSARGQNGYIINYDGTITAAYGIYSRVRQYKSGTMTTAYGVESRVEQEEGAIDTGYLYHGAFVGTVGTKWGLYLTGETNNYLSGTLGIKTASVTAGAALDLSGATGTAFSSLIVPKDTTANRPTTGVVGMMRYNTTLGAFEGYTASGWGSLGSGGTGSSLLGASALTANPYRDGETNTGLFSPGSGSVAVTSLGSEVLRVTSSGYVGIGNPSPTAALDIVGDVTTTGNMALGGGGIGPNVTLNIAQTGTDADKTALWISKAVSGTNSVGHANYGMRAAVTNSSNMSGYANNLFANYVGVTNNEGGSYSSAYGVYSLVQNNDSSNTQTSSYGIFGDVNNSSTGTLFSAIGMFGRARNSSTGTMTQVWGTVGSVVNDAGGTITNAQASRNAVRNDEGAITSASGSQNYIGQSVAGGSISTAFGNYNWIEQTAGTINTGYLYYGIYSGTIGTKWGLYLTGETNNYLSGTLGIKTASVTAGAALDLSGATGTAYSSFIVPKDTSANRPTTGTVGMIRYNTTLGAFEGYTASGWGSLGGGTSAGGSGTSMVSGWPDVLFCSNLGTGLSAAAPTALYATYMPYNGLYYYATFYNGGTQWLIYNADGSFNSSQGMSSTNCNVAMSANVAAGRAFNIVGGASGGTSSLGTSATAANPARSDDATTGLFSATASTVSIATSGTERLRIDGAGNVGIGTSAPSNKLEIVDEANLPFAVKEYNSTAGAGVTLRGSRARGTAAAPTAVQSGDHLFGLRAFGYTGSAFSTTSRAHLDFWAAENWSSTANGTYTTLSTTEAGTIVPVERMRITSEGYVGIGTTSPEYLMDIVGAAGAGSPVARVKTLGNTFSDRAAFLLMSPSYNGYMNLESDTGNLNLGTQSTRRITITSTGFVGIGTTSPGYLLDLTNATNVGQFHVSGSGADNGGYILGLSNGMYLGGNAYYNGTNWIAKSATPSLIAAGSGAIYFYTDTGQTAGSSYTPSNRVAITATGSVGIGTTAPAQKLSVAGDIAIGTGTNVYATTPNGGAAITLNGPTSFVRHVMNDGNGNYNVYLNSYRDSSGSVAVYQQNAAANLMSTSAGTFGFYVAPAGTAGGAVTWTVGLHINNSGFVGLGTSASTTYPLLVGSTATNGAGAFLSAAGVWTSASDRRLKEDIRPIEYNLDTVMKLKPVSYEMKGTHRKQVGFIAQDVAEVVPEVTEVSPEGKYGLSYGNMVALTVKAIQELKGETDALKAQLAAAAPKEAQTRPVQAEGGPDQSLLYLLLFTIGVMSALILGLYLSLSRRIAALERELRAVQEGGAG